jgi:hypothetical protein
MLCATFCWRQKRKAVDGSDNSFIVHSSPYEIGHHMKDIEDILPKDGANMGEVMEAVASAVAIVMATSLPDRFAALHAAMYLMECITKTLQEIEAAGEANWSVKNKGELQ